MSTVQIQPMQWKAVVDINDVARFSEEDAECFREIRDVLQKHNALERFGITLIHKHFDVSPDEEMMEYTDHENRVLTIKPIKKAAIDWQSITTTNWKFTDGAEVATARCVCARVPDSHLGYHRSA